MSLRETIIPTNAPHPIHAERRISESGFRYEEAFGRNIGWVTEWEQQVLRHKKIAIAGMGGVGGAYVLSLARLGIGGFHIADLDEFELANFNRQMGASIGTLGQPKARVLQGMAKDINPEAAVRVFEQGIDDGNIDDFLEGVDLFIDGFDFFVLDIRAKVFARCAELGIPAITAAPVGMGVAYLIFMPNGMTFENYFRLEGLSKERQYVNFLAGLNPKGYHRAYLADPSRVDFGSRRVPSTGMACQLCAGIVGTEALKILLERGGMKAAPWYHQFDAYRGKWHVGWLPGGNRHPLQVLKRHVGYRAFAKLSEISRPSEEPAGESEIEQILDLSRWAPSGDNSQPWRFETTGEDSLQITVLVENDNVYEYAQGQPTLLSAGFLLETMRIAATRYGRMLWWSYRGVTDNAHVIDVELPKTPSVTEDALCPYIPIRSVDRRPYRNRRLTPEQKERLAAALGDELSIRWFEALSERWKMARLNARATDIRLRIPEAFKVHRQVLDWNNKYSPSGVPVEATGLDHLTIRIMKWAMADWRRMDRMNRLPGGTFAARLQMDYLPGFRCAAHFMISHNSLPDMDDRVPALIRTGQALQRFWLTAAEMGIAMQPGLAPLCFVHYGRNGITFSESAWGAKAAMRLVAEFEKLSHEGGREVLFSGRVGKPLSRIQGTRSVRRPLRELQTGEDRSG